MPKTLPFPVVLPVLMAVALVLAGCENKTVVTPVATEPDIVTVKLAQAADKASNALDTISGIESQRAPLPRMENYDNAPPNLTQPISLRWSGPIEPVLRILADRAGMRFHVKGNQPPVALTVNIDAYQQPIFHILRDLGLQAGHRADIAVDASAGTIELRYAASDRSN